MDIICSTFGFWAGSGRARSAGGAARCVQYRPGGGGLRYCSAVRGQPAARHHAATPLQRERSCNKHISQPRRLLCPDTHPPGSSRPASAGHHRPREQLQILYTKCQSTVNSQHLHLTEKPAQLGQCALLSLCALFSLRVRRGLEESLQGLRPGSRPTALICGLIWCDAVSTINRDHPSEASPAGWRTISTISCC